MTKTLTIRLSTEALDDLERLAGSTKRSKAFLAAQAVAEFVANQKWQTGALDEARSQISRGEVVSAEDVKTWLQTWGAEHPSPAPHGRHQAGRTKSSA